jgi:hypothetical protein
VRPLLISNSEVPNPELPPFERFTKFTGMIAKVSKAEADKERSGAGSAKRTQGEGKRSKREV